jgi:hypothetical protein
MKKLESVLRGLPGRGITSPFTAFPQFLFGLRSLILPKKFTMRGGGNDYSPEERYRACF